MDKVEVVSLEGALQRVSDFYKPSIRYLYQSALLPGESVVFVAISTKHVMLKQDHWSSFWSEWRVSTSYTNTPSLIMLTTQRWVRKWTFGANEQGLLLFDKNEQERFLKTLKNGYRWAEPAGKSPPDENHPERQGKSIEDWAMTNMVFLPLREISASAKSICFTHHAGVQNKRLLLAINDDHFSLLFDEGEQLFQLLQKAASNGGRILLAEREAQKKESSDTEVLQRLRRLKELFDANVITEAEYQRKKEEILSSL